MPGYRPRRIFPVVLVLIMVAVAIVGLVYAAQMLFFNGSKSASPKTDISQAALTNTSANRSVIMTVRGQIVAEENFRTYQIKISPNERIFTAYKGYMNQQIDTVKLTNNTPAYEQFVYALNRASFMNANELTGDRNDTRGICATGYLYEFQMMESNKTIKQLWTTSCPNSRGSLGVSVSPIMNLFVVQIPDVQSKVNAIW